MRKEKFSEFGTKMRIGSHLLTVLTSLLLSSCAGMFNGPQVAAATQGASAFSLANSTVVVNTTNLDVSSTPTAQVMLIAKDASGHQLPVGGLTVTFAIQGGASVGTVGSTNDHGDGTYSASITIAPAAVGTALVVSAQINGSALSNQPPAIPIVNGSTQLLGQTASTQWMLTGKTFVSGTFDGAFVSPSASFVDSNHYLYVLDGSRNRIVKFDNTNGHYMGWIGNIYSADSLGGSTSCSTAVPGTSTPGWCTGGYSASGTGDGMMNGANSFWGDGSYLYVGDYSNARILRFNASTGVFDGWIGKISSTTGLGGAAGCSTASTGQATPGWCTGGTSTNGSGNGMFNNPQGVWGDGTYLYISDQTRVDKIVASSGAFVGWIGNISSTSGLGGAAGCAAASTNTFTPGWCTGGTSTTGSGDGTMNGSRSLWTDGVTLYVVDNGNSRVSKYSAVNGAFEGWIGQIASTAGLGGAAGCATASVGQFTPGWCTGGTGHYGVGATGDGALNSPTGIWSDGNYLYVTDTNNNRINRYVAATGGSEGWIGAVSTTAGLGGAVGCASAQVGTFTPGWCTGGNAGAVGSGDGMLYGPVGVTGDGTNLYVSDSGNFRVSKYVALSGAFEGATGAVLNPIANTWSSSIPGSYSSAGTGDGAINGANKLFNDGTYIYVADTGNNRIERFYTTTGIYAGWIGAIGSTIGLGGGAGCAGASAGTFTPTWCTGGTANSGSGDGMLNAPQGLWGDGTNLYVADRNNYRVSKYLASTGAFEGWVGWINSNAGLGGNAACLAAGTNVVTPTWCTGGSSMSAANGLGGFAAPQGLWSDGNYLYIVDYNANDISRYLLNGTFSGWLGKISSTSGLGGATGCAAAASGTFTPGWCTGGTPTSGTGSGMMSNPQGVWGDATSLYVADFGNSRINKYTTLSGAFVGWIGTIGTTTGLGGASGCATATVGQFTPGWCTGGTPTTGSGDGMLNRPPALVTDGTYLYVSDYKNYRLSKYNSLTGAFVGWKGLVGTTPTGGDTGCTQLAANVITPGWCTGGKAEFGSLTPGAYGAPTGIIVDNYYVYTADNTFSAIVRTAK